MSPYEDMIHELPNGQLVCAQHFLVVCGICTLDFSFMNEDGYDEDDHKKDERKKDDRKKNDRKKNDRKKDDRKKDDRKKDDRKKDDRKKDDAPIILSSRLADHKKDDHDLREKLGLGPPKKKYTGRILPSKFVPPTSTTKPLDLFHGVNTYYHFVRYVHTQDSSIGLIFTDGACLNNGKANPRAGWGIVGSPPECVGTYSCANVKGRLEKKGPFDDDGPQTSNRAELRAVLVALGLRHWPGEGFKTLVIATDSEYVVEGATKWTRGWLKNGWMTSNRTPVKNQDMWEMLLTEVERFEGDGMAVQFWRIGRELNVAADKLAREGAAEDANDTYTKIFGI